MHGDPGVRGMAPGTVGAAAVLRRHVSVHCPLWFMDLASANHAC